MATATATADGVNVFEPDLEVRDDYWGRLRSVRVVPSQTGKWGLRTQFQILNEDGSPTGKTYFLQRYPSLIEHTETYHKARAGAARDEEILDLPEFSIVQDKAMLESTAKLLRAKIRKLEVPLRVTLVTQGPLQLKQLEFAEPIILTPMPVEEVVGDANDEDVPV